MGTVSECYDIKRTALRLPLGLPLAREDGKFTDNYLLNTFVKVFYFLFASMVLYFISFGF